MSDVRLGAHQLALYNGVDKPKTYVAYLGKIYDVSGSPVWKRGQHFEHWAGQDLTEELVDAPHAAEVFERFPCVGEIVTG